MMTYLTIKVDFTQVCTNRKHKLHDMLARLCLVLPLRFNESKVSVIVDEPDLHLDRFLGRKALVISACLK